MVHLKIETLLQPINDTGKLVFLSFIILLLTKQSIGQKKYVNFSQDSSSAIDLEQILFKAKLLTLTSYGTVDSLALIKALTDQKAEVIENPHGSDFVIINIENRQGRIILTDFISGRESRFCNQMGNENFVVVFSYIERRFYRIVGFGFTEIDRLERDINGSNLFLSESIRERPGSVKALLSRSICEALKIDLKLLQSTARKKEKYVRSRECNICPYLEGRGGEEIY